MKVYYHYIFCSLISLLSCIFPLYSNAEDNCISLATFTSLETKSASDIRLALEKEKWKYIDEKKSSSYSFIDAKLNFNVLLFENELHIKLYICTSNDSPNLLICRSNESCYKSMIAEVKKIGYPSTFTHDSCKITNLSREGQIIEFRETQNTNENDFFIIDYNPTKIKYSQIYLGFKSYNFTAPSNERIHKTRVYSEIMPSFPGGDKKMFDFIRENIEYPALAIKKGITGRVFVVFTVDTVGNIVNPKILRSIGGGCDEEALRILSLMPKWTPGYQDGKAVEVSFTIPFNFE